MMQWAGLQGFEVDFHDCAFNRGQDSSNHWAVAARQITKVNLAMTIFDWNQGLCLSVLCSWHPWVLCHVKVVSINGDRTPGLWQTVICLHHWWRWQNMWPLNNAQGIHTRGSSKPRVMSVQCAPRLSGAVSMHCAEPTPRPIWPCGVHLPLNYGQPMPPLLSWMDCW